MANITGTSRFLRILAERGTTGLVELVDEDLSFNGSHTIQSIGGTLTINAFTLGGAITGAGQVLSNIGTVYIGDTANTKMTLGLTINQGEADNEILSLKSSDVAHGITDQTETNTFGRFGKSVAATGGLYITGLSSATGGIEIFGMHATDNTAKTTGASAAARIHAFLKSGTGVDVCGVDANLCTIENGTTVRFIFDAEGSGHADVEWVAYDKYNDLALVKDAEMLLLDRETEVQTYRRHELETAGIIGKDSWHFENGKPRAMVNFTKLAMLHHGALIQVAERMSLIEAENKLLREQVAGRLR